MLKLVRHVYIRYRCRINQVYPNRLNGTLSLHPEILCRMEE